MKIKWKFKKLDLLEVIQATNKEIFIKTENEEDFNKLHETLRSLNIGEDLNKVKFKDGGLGFFITSHKNFGAFDTKSAKREGAEIYQYSQFKT